MFGLARIPPRTTWAALPWRRSASSPWSPASATGWQAGWKRTSHGTWFLYCYEAVDSPRLAVSRMHTGERHPLRVVRGLAHQQLETGQTKHGVWSIELDVRLPGVPHTVVPSSASNSRDLSHRRTLREASVHWRCLRGGRARQSSAIRCLHHLHLPAKTRLLVARTTRNPLAAALLVVCAGAAFHLYSYPRNRLRSSLQLLVRRWTWEQGVRWFCSQVVGLSNRGDG